MGLLYQLEYAGCLAHLAACEGLREYDRNCISLTDTNGRSRRQVLFDTSLDTYNAIMSKIHPDNIDLRSLVVSGRAHAYTLQGRYEDAMSMKEGITDTSKQVINPNFQKAFDELLELIRQLPEEEDCSVLLRRQLENTQDARYGHYFAEGEEEVATQELFKLTKVALAGV